MRDLVYAVARAVRTWSLPSGQELAFARERAAPQATQYVLLARCSTRIDLDIGQSGKRLVQLLATH
jgi:hypothetical protein